MPHLITSSPVQTKELQVEVLTTHAEKLLTINLVSEIRMAMMLCQKILILTAILALFSWTEQYEAAFQSVSICNMLVKNP